MSNLEHDLFLLLINLSQLNSRDLIFSTFMDAANSMFDNIELRRFDSSDEVSGETIEIATRKMNFGKIAIQQTGDALSSNELPLLHNVVRMLAVILEKHENDRLLDSEMKLLEALVDDRTDELKQTNQRLTREITERKRAEEKSGKSENRYRELFDNMSSGVAVYRAVEEGEDFVFVDLNRSGENMEGVSKKDIIGRKVTDAFPGVEEFGLLDIFRRVWQTGKPQQHPVSFYKDQRLKSWRTNYVYKLPEGEIVAVYDDITERMQADENLKNSEKWFRTTLASVGDAVITTDTEGQVSFFNPTAQHLTGWDLEQARGRPLTDVFNIVSEQTHQPVENPVQKVLRENIAVGLANHTLLISKEGVERPIADSGAPIEDDEGNVLGVVLVFRDMTEQRELEANMRQQQKLESIGTLAGGVAHEINNPVNIIMNYAERILDDAENGSELADISDQIISECKRIADIVRNLLSFARQEKESHSPARIKDIVSSTLTLISKVIKKDQISIQVDIEEDLPNIKCRSQQIMQVLMNLLTNARDALNERYQGYDENKTIFVSSRLLERDGRRWIRTTVEDRGAGISPKVVERIMDPFFTTKGRDRGTGLGLSVSHGIVTDHHGKLSFESENGKFTRFHMDLSVDNGWSLT